MIEGRLLVGNSARGKSVQARFVIGSAPGIGYQLCMSKQPLELTQIHNAILAGNKIEAIKQYREWTGAGLAEAKEEVERMESALRGRGDVAVLGETQGGVLDMAIFAGRKIEAVRMMREQTGKGLKESKEAVEQREMELRAAHPERFAVAKGGGCLPLAMVFSAGGACIWALGKLCAAWAM